MSQPIQRPLPAPGCRYRNRSCLRRGQDRPEVWAGLLAGKSGMAEIKAFDLTGHPVRFAAEVKDFDPLLFIEKKESRKMGRFIHFAHGRLGRGDGALRPCDR